MGRRNGMKKAHKKVVGELTIDTGFAQASHTPVQQCNAACRISKAPAPSPSCGYGASDVTPWLLLGARGRYGKCGSTTRSRCDSHLINM